MTVYSFQPFPLRLVLGEGCRWTVDGGEICVVGLV